MGSNKYTVMFIPESESGTTSYHLSKNLFLIIISVIIMVIVCGLAVMFYFVPKISDYASIKERHDTFVSERMKVIELTRDLERIRQMDDLVRSSLGTTLDIDSRPELVDSVSGIYELPKRKVSYIENIPSVPPIRGYITQTPSREGLFIRDAHNGIDIVAKEGEPQEQNYKFPHPTNY